MTWQFQILRSFCEASRVFVPPPPAINASLGAAAAAAELRVTYAGTAALQVTGSCVVEHFWLLNHAEQEGLETQSELKIKNHHQHSEIGGVSLTVCMHVLGHRGAHTHSHTHGVYHVSTFPRSPPSRMFCSGNFFNPPDFCCHYQSQTHTRPKKSKEVRTLIALVTSHDDILDLQIN